MGGGGLCVKYHYYFTSFICKFGFVDIKHSPCQRSFYNLSSNESLSPVCFTFTSTDASFSSLLVNAWLSKPFDVSSTLFVMIASFVSFSS